MVCPPLITQVEKMRGPTKRAVLIAPLQFLAYSIFATS
jgi:hypothetical protein